MLKSSLPRAVNFRREDVYWVNNEFWENERFMDINVVSEEEVPTADTDTDVDVRHAGHAQSSHNFQFSEQKLVHNSKTVRIENDTLQQIVLVLRWLYRKVTKVTMPHIPNKS